MIRISEEFHQNRAFATILESEASLKNGQTSTELALKLVDESKDVLAIALDKKVALTNMFYC